MTHATPGEPKEGFNDQLAVFNREAVVMASPSSESKWDAVTFWMIIP